MTTLPPELSPLDGPPPYDLSAEPPAEPDELASWEHAEWALRSLAETQAELTLLDDRYAAQRQRLDDWYDSVARPLLHRLDFLRERLELWARAERDRTGKASFRFPAGDISTTLRKDPRVVVADEESLLAWCHESLDRDLLPTVIGTTEHVRVKELRAVLAIDGVTVVDPNTGEAVPGVSVDPPSLSVTVKPTQLQEDQP